MTALMWLGAALACLSAALAVWTATSPAGLSLVRGLLGRLRVRIEGLGRGGLAAKGPPRMTGPLGKLLARLGRATRVGVRRGGEARAKARDRSRCLDELPELVDFANRLEKATIDTIEAGEMTGDLARITTLENPTTLNTRDFIGAIAGRLRG